MYVASDFNGSRLVLISLTNERFGTDIVGKLGYPAQPKITDLEATWPYRPGSSDLDDLAFYLPGNESEQQAKKFMDIYTTN